MPRYGTCFMGYMFVILCYDNDYCQREMRVHSGEIKSFLYQERDYHKFATAFVLPVVVPVSAQYRLLSCMFVRRASPMTNCASRVLPRFFQSTSNVDSHNFERIHFEACFAKVQFR